MGILQWFRRSGGGESPSAGWFRGAQRVRVREMKGFSPVKGMVVDPKLLYETADPDEIAGLVNVLRTGPGNGDHCMCNGTLVYEIESRTGTRRISLHHGITLRVESASEDVPLVSPDACMDWLSARGIAFVREEYEQNLRSEAESRAHVKRWRAALPASLAPFFDDMDFGGKPRPEWEAALAAEYPDLPQRAAALLRWFGAGAGPWRRHPSYESVPEGFLLEMPLEALLATAASDDRVLEGAARLFSGLEFGRRRGDDRAALPADLKRRLLEHAERSEHEDNRARARAAFAG